MMIVMVLNDDYADLMSFYVSLVWKDLFKCDWLHLKLRNWTKTAHKIT